MNRNEFVRNVESCQKQVRRFLTALCCGDSTMADDIAQDSFVKAYLSCDNLTDDNKFMSWIYRIAYNTFISSRRVSHATTFLEDAANIESKDTSDSAFRYQELYKALDMLSVKERTSILLFYMHGYDIKEIEKIIDSTSDAIKQHLSRGRLHLKKLLQEECYGR